MKTGLIIIVDGSVGCLAVTSTINNIREKYSIKNLDVLVKDESTKDIFKYNKKINKVETKSSAIPKLVNKRYDYMFNFSDKSNLDYYDFIKCENKIGVGLDESSTTLYNKIKNGNHIKKNIYQIYFNLIKETWKGEGINLNYFPKTHEIKNKTGLYITNDNLKRYVISNIKLDFRLENICFKKGLYNFLDELNIYENIVTEDVHTALLATYLRKNIYFLKSDLVKFKMEFFGTGEEIKIPINIYNNMI